MKIKDLISIVILIGLLILFFFPEPETNFIAYFGVFLFFVIIVIILIILSKKNKI